MLLPLRFTEEERRTLSTDNLPIEAERDLILTAQDRANAGARDTALGTLWQAYRPAVEQAVRRYGEHADTDDLRQEVYVAFLEAVEIHDVERTARLWNTLRPAMHEALMEAVTQAGAQWAIPTRTLKRWHGILRRADGDVDAAAALAPAFRMRTDTFLHIAGLLRGTAGSEALKPGRKATVVGADEGDAFVDVEDATLAHAAREALGDGTQRSVVDRAYGFVPVEVDGALIDPTVPDALVGASLGIGRRTTQRHRAKALATMREAIGLAREEN